MSQVAALFAELSELWRPPAEIALSDWAEKNLVLSREYASQRGQLKLLGWQRKPFDSFTDPLVERIVIMCGTQLIKTLFIQAALAYVIAEKPGPVLIVTPKEADAQTFSKERLAPMIRDCDILRGKVSDAKSRDSSNTTLYKQFPGGGVTLVGANAPSNLARRSIQYLFCDEIDKYPLSAGSEGDPIDLARERTVTYGSRRKIIEVCSPTIHGRSRIAKSYSESDQQKPYVPCWKCGEYQVLAWENVRLDNRFSDPDSRARTAFYECPKCNARWDDEERWRSCELAQWRPSQIFAGTRGFWISHLYSPWKRVPTMALDFLMAKKTTQSLQVFINTALAEEWKQSGERPDWERLYERRENYDVGIVPAKAPLVTAAVDVQADRLEFEVKAWGPGKENWSIYYEVIQPRRLDRDGEPTIICRTNEPEPWKRLAELIAKDWPVEGGGTIPIRAVAIDTGYNPELVYDFCRRYARPSHGMGQSIVGSFRTTIPVKGGSDEKKIIQGVSDTDAARKRYGLKIVTIGTHAAKQEIYEALRLPAPIDGQPYPAGYYHQPDYDSAYFQGLTAETQLVKGLGFEWRKDGRNEPLDLAVYNRAAASLCGIDIFSDPESQEWKTLAELIAATKEPAEADAQASEAPERSRYIPRKNWFRN